MGSSKKRPFCKLRFEGMCALPERMSYTSSPTSSIMATSYSAMVQPFL